MPAILPARLKQQVALLLEHFENPLAFVRSLRHLFEFYADNAVRPGMVGEPQPLLLTYRIRSPVLRQIVLDLVPSAVEYPGSALLLCDELWRQPYLEFRLLAVSLVGEIPVDPSGPVIDRVLSWVQTRPEERILKALLTTGLATLHRDDPHGLLNLIQVWLAASEVYYRQIGLRALVPFIEDQDFENLPLIFRLIQPLSRTIPAALRPDLLAVIAALTARSPREAAYFLRQNLELPNNPDAAWLIRQSAVHFPSEIQEELRKAAREKDHRTAKV